MLYRVTVGRVNPNQQTVPIAIQQTRTQQRDHEDASCNQMEMVFTAIIKMIPSFVYLVLKESSV
jgi:hypothetical protein